jgi:hypothetical protein
MIWIKRVPAPKKPLNIFLPHFGEYGWFLLRYVREVYDSKLFNKIICCKRGQEGYFPNATGFFYDWENPVPEVERQDSMGFKLHNDARVIEECARIKTEIIKNISLINHDTKHVVFPLEINCVKYQTEPGDLSIPNEFFKISPEIKCLNPIGIKTDVVIAPRFRQFDSQRNWPKENWELVIEEIKKLNLSFSICGSKETSFDFPDALHRSWEFESPDQEIEMMQNCMYFVGLNSGVTQLACLLKKDSMIIMQGEADPCFERYIKKSNPNAYIPERHKDRCSPHFISGFIGKTLKYMIESEERKRKGLPV